jgi:adenosylcobinamide-GDP ribazoletransferase
MRRRLPDAWRLAVGTLTAIPVKAPARVDRDTAGLAMVLAPVAVVPLGVLVTLVLWGGRELGLNPLAVGMLGVGALALGSRAFHLDGLADTADALTASYDRERSLEVMKSGSAGPAGVAAIVVVLGVQSIALGVLISSGTGLAVAGVLVCFSRVALTITCARGVPAARPDGLGAATAHSVPRSIAVMSWSAAAAIAAAVAEYSGGTWWHVVIGFAVAAAVVALLVVRAVRRLGGVTGDIYGAAIEVALAILLLSA